jgi:hypothetical protein
MSLLLFMFGLGLCFPVPSIVVDMKEPLLKVEVQLKALLELLWVVEWKG